ncbi:MAG TPA: fructosamine kinase family protein [Allosphingosinicella sp.]|nr:fructosamine kinase family protein [Allosphingosinicella sp.]
MTAFARRVAELTGVAEDRLERLAGGDLSEALLVRRPDGRLSVAKRDPAGGAEAAMLRAIAAAGVPAPLVEGEHDGVLLLEHLANDRVFSPVAWAEIGAALRRLHDREGEQYGWGTDYQIGTVVLDNRERRDWPGFWGEQRLIATASVLDRPWRARVAEVAERLGDLLPAAPRPSLLHGDLWSGNILVADGRLAAFIDPACYHGDGEVDLAMLTLFDGPGDSFWDAYGRLEPGWEERRPVYQLFPALLNLRLWGNAYAGTVDRLLSSLGAG